MLKLLASVFGCTWPGWKRIATRKIEAKPFKLFPRVFKKIDIIGRGLFSLCELRLYLPLDVERYCSEWIKLATTIFRIVWAKNLRKYRDRAPLSTGHVTNSFPVRSAG